MEARTMDHVFGSLLSWNAGSQSCTERRTDICELEQR
jgi:hypothetical protein